MVQGDPIKFGEDDGLKQKKRSRSWYVSRLYSQLIRPWYVSRLLVD